MRAIILQGLVRDKKVLDWAREWDILVNKSKSHLLTNASKGMIVVGENSEFQIDAVRGTRDLGIVSIAGYNCAEQCKTRVALRDDT